MGLFRPYERKAADAESTTAPERTKDSGRISSLTPRGDKRATGKAATPESSTPPVESTSTKQVITRTPQKKQTATPTRKQAEAERMQRLHPSLSKKDQRRADRDAKFNSRTDTWERVEASPERVLLRDYIDVRWTVTEFMLPAMLIIMAAVVATSQWLTVSSYIAAGLWVILALSFINTFIMWRGFKNLLAERLPDARRRGLLMYMFNRSLMIRRFRRPAPRVVRGASI